MCVCRTRLFHHPTHTTQYSNQQKNIITHNKRFASVTNRADPADGRRPYTLREAARFQSVPDHITFSGTPPRIAISINDCVPPRLSRAVAATILEASGANPGAALRNSPCTTTDSATREAVSSLSGVDVREANAWLPVHVNECHSYLDATPAAIAKSFRDTTGRAESVSMCGCEGCNRLVMKNRQGPGLTFDVYYGEYWRQAGYGRKSKRDKFAPYIQADFELMGSDVVYDFFERELRNAGRIR